MYIGKNSIGEMIRVLRTERGMSREELAERVRVSRSHLNKIEADIKRPSIITYQKIMEVLNADISIQDEEKTEKGKCVAKAKDILMNRSEKEDPIGGDFLYEIRWIKTFSSPPSHIAFDYFMCCVPTGISSCNMS